MSLAAPPNVTHLFPAGGQRGTTVEVTAAGTFDDWPVKVWASGTGVTAEAAKDKGKFRVAVAADAAAGVYWLRPHAGAGGGNLRPFVVGTLPEVAEAEPNDEPAKPQRVGAAVVVNGRLAKAGDVDCYAVPLTKGQTLVASVESHRTLRSPADAVLQVASADGFVLAQDNDARDLDPELAFTAPADGTYLVRVFAFPAAPDSSIRFFGGDAAVYRLTLTTGGFADFAWPLAVARGRPSAVKLVGWNLPDPARPAEMTADTDEVAVGHPTVGNVVRVRVEPHPVVDATAGDGLKLLSPPVSVAGRIDRPDGPARIPIQARKGQPITLTVESRRFGLSLATTARVLDGAGKQVARGEPAKPGDDTAVRFTPPADGIYTVEVRDPFGNGGPRAVFLLRVLPDAPAFTLSVPADRLTVTPGKPTDVAVTVNRSGGFDQELELSAVGLPAGVTAVAVPPKGKGEKTITLRLSTDKSGAAGSFRIAGQVKGTPTSRRVATAAISELGTSTSDLWVTAVAVPPKK